MGHGFLGLEHAPWPPAIDGSDSDPVIPPKRKIPWGRIIGRLAIAVVLTFIVGCILARALVRQTMNASMRYSPKVHHYVQLYPLPYTRPTVKN